MDTNFSIIRSSLRKVPQHSAETSSLEKEDADRKSVV